MSPRSALIARPCRSRCSWLPSRTGGLQDGPNDHPNGGGGGSSERLPLFACTGCGTQWEPGLGWTPIDADGSVPAEVRAATSGRPAGGAGSAGN